MAELAYIKLGQGEIERGLGELEGWGYDGDKISKTYAFKTYKDGVVFAAAVGHVADKLNHHPDILVGYAKATVSVNTHDVGGISPYDFELARRIDALA
ncbi:MAG TPA: 4a-hydroxytetrahydrobiopterin dehydratase [Fimbriimonadaceae bacterium]|nr:4a-hydroxytetrahydrobiopterin dehydratase [Fimbriimonadaceae bacterium]